MLTLHEALLCSLFALGGETSTQFGWNLHIFLDYMWLHDVFNFGIYKFEKTKYGPWCSQIKQEITYLEQRGYISSDWTPLEYQSFFDTLITNEFFENTRSYYMTESGATYLSHTARKNDIILNDPEIEITHMYREDDISFLLLTIRQNFPDMFIKE